MKYIIPIVYTFLYACTILVNYLSTSLPLNGKTTGELSDKYDSMITPAGPAFSIWGVIYLLLAYFIFVIWKSYRNNNLEAMASAKKLLPFFIANMILNMSWLVVWHYELIPLSIIVMFGLLFSLILIYRKVSEDGALSRVPWSVYLGWVSVASIVNVSVLLLYLGWDSSMGNPLIYTFALCGVAYLLALYFYSKRDVYYVATIIWALTFVAVANRRTEVFYYTIFIINVVFIGLVLFRNKILSKSL